jgi:hypothetical protein
MQSYAEHWKRPFGSRQPDAARYLTAEARNLTPPRFHVHQNVGKFLMNRGLRLTMSTGGNAAAKRLGIPQSTMTNWVRQRREEASAPIAGAAVAVKRPVSELEAQTKAAPRHTSN